MSNSTPPRKHESAIACNQAATNSSLINSHVEESLWALIGTCKENFPLKDGRLSTFIAFFTLDFFIKLKAQITDRFSSQNEICSIAKLLLDKERNLIVATIIACDICRMYQQQIKLIDGRALGYYIKAFAQDCVDRILQNIRKHQLRFKQSSHNIELTRRTRFTDVQGQENINDDEKLQKSAADLIEGLWTNNSKKKRKRQWVSGKQLFVSLKCERAAKEKLYKIISGNLLDRIYVKVGDEYYFPKKNCKVFRRLIAKLPGRLINHPQDHVTKLCGYRLTSLIHTFKLHSNAQKIDPPNFQHLQHLNNNALLSLHNFEDLKQFAEQLVNYYNSSS